MLASLLGIRGLASVACAAFLGLCSGCLFDSPGGVPGYGVPALKQWPEVPGLMALVAEDPEGAVATNADQYLQDLVPGSWFLRGFPQLWLLWWEVERERHPGLKDMPGYDIGAVAFEAARQSEVYQDILGRLRGGRGNRKDFDVLGVLRRPDSLELLTTHVKVGKDPSSLRTAIDVMVLIDDPQVLPTLMGFAATGPDSARPYASQWVARLQDPRTVLFCLHGLQGETRVEQFSAHLALRQMTGQEFGRKDVRGWAEWWVEGRARFPPQLLPPGLDEETILRSAKGGD